MKFPDNLPVKKVLLQVVAENQKDGSNYTASTDKDGHFRIDGVVPGRYRIYLEKTGFLTVDYRGKKSEINVLTVQAGKSTEDLLLRLVPAAVVSGRITDEEGDPFPNLRVVALKKIPGKSQRHVVGTESTNDLGEYRLAGLPPGQYWIAAIPPPDFRDYEKRPGTEAQVKAYTRYFTTYYPGTFDANQGTSVTLKAGEEAPVNLTMIPSKAYTVRGIVTGGGSAQKLTVELVSKAGDSLHANEVGPNGRFELRGVGPGLYFLRASSLADSQQLTAKQEIIVNGDVDGIRLTPQAAFTISGRLRVEGNVAKSLSQFSVSLHPDETSGDIGFFMSPDLFGASARVDISGNFEWKGVFPGNYTVQFYGGSEQESFFVKSVTLGGREVETGFSVGGPAALEVTLSSRAGVVEGVVVDREKDVDRDYPVANATVVAVPEEKFRGLPYRYGADDSDQNGHFMIRGLAPGNYTVFAWRNVDETLYRNEEFLQSQAANGVSIKVSEGSRQTINPKLSASPED